MLSVPCPPRDRTARIVLVRGGILGGVILGLLVFSPPSVQGQGFVGNFTTGLGQRPKPVNTLSGEGGTFVRHTTGEIQAQIAQVEHQLYGRSYPETPLTQRFRRVETTLFGTVRNDDLENRLAAIQQKLKIGSGPNTDADQHGPLVEYLERKLFQRTFPELTFERRLDQLESHVFGKTYGAYPADARMKKLTYTIPIAAREIRVTREGKPVATTRRPSAPVFEGVEAQRSVVATVSRETATSDHFPDDYLANTFREPDGRFLRWETLPVKVYLLNATADEETLSEVAFARWRRYLPIEPVKSRYEADILIDWNRVPPSPNPITRPILHWDNAKTLRTVILIDMTPYKFLPAGGYVSAATPEERAFRGLLHQLGHACGLWGHSADPDDMMYPVGALELNDIPPRWNQRSPGPATLSANFRVLPEDPMPSPRDINTLTRIYDQAGQDLRRYSPYR